MQSDESLILFLFLVFAIIVTILFFMKQQKMLLKKVRRLSDEFGCDNAMAKLTAKILDRALMEKASAISFCLSPDNSARATDGSGEVCSSVGILFHIDEEKRKVFDLPEPILLPLLAQFEWMLHNESKIQMPLFDEVMNEGRYKKEVTAKNENEYREMIALMRKNGVSETDLPAFNPEDFIYYGTSRKKHPSFSIALGDWKKQAEMARISLL